MPKIIIFLKITGAEKCISTRCTPSKVFWP
jgi:hypothetical protein